MQYIGAMEREEMIREAREILKKGGFIIGEIVGKSTIFDIAARRDDILFIIKVLFNVDSLRSEMARELKILGKELNSSPFIIGKRSGLGEIIDGVVYTRYGIPAISMGTFRDFILENIYPAVYVAPGGFYVNIDGSKLRRIREEKMISLGYLAEIAGVSRKAIQLYEGGMGSTVDVALKLEKLLGENLILPIDILHFGDLKEERIKNPENFLGDIYYRLRDMGYDVLLTLKCPFDAISKDKKDILLTGVEETERRIKAKSMNMRTISEIFEKRGFIVVGESKYTDYNGIAIIRRYEFMKYSKDELKEIVEERSSI